MIVVDQFRFFTFWSHLLQSTPTAPRFFFVHSQISVLAQCISGGAHVLRIYGLTTPLGIYARTIAFTMFAFQRAPLCGVNIRAPRQRVTERLCDMCAWRPGGRSRPVTGRNKTFRKRGVPGGGQKRFNVVFRSVRAHTECSGSEDIKAVLFFSIVLNIRRVFILQYLC